MRDVIRFLPRRSYIRRRLVLCILLILGGLAKNDAQAEDFSQNSDKPPSSLQERCTEVDRAIFFELVKLAKFNVHFHMEANRHQKWRSLAYPLAREAGTALTFSATLIDLAQLTKGLDSPASPLLVCRLSSLATLTPQGRKCFRFGLIRCRRATDQHCVVDAEDLFWSQVLEHAQLFALVLCGHYILRT